MRYAITFLLGLLAVPWLYLPLQAQALTVAQADSLRLLLGANQANTSRVGALLRLSAHYQGRTLNYAHNLDTALIMAGQAQALSQQLQYGKGQQEAFYQQGKIFIKQEKLGRVHRMLPTVSALTRIRLWLELGKNKLRPTYSQEANLDSALWYFSQAQRLSERMGSQRWQEESQLLTGVAYLFKGDCKRSQVWFMQVIQARQRAGDGAGELRVWLRWALTPYSEWKCYVSPDSLSRAFTLARQLNDKPSEVFLLLMGSYKHLDKGNQRRGEREALQALAIQKAIGYAALNRAFHALVEENDYLQHVYLFNLFDANGLLADIAEFTPNATKGVFYNLEVVRNLERGGLWEDLDWPYFWLGNSYYQLGQYTKGVAYYQQSLAVSHRKGEVAVYPGMIRRMTESLTREGKTHQALQLLKDYNSQHPPLDYGSKMSIALGFGQCYAALKQNKLAEQYYLESVTWGEKGSDAIMAWLHISKFYVATAQYAKATHYLKQKAGVITSMSTSQRQQLYLLQFKVDSAQANYSSALRHYQRYTALKDSVLNETTSQQIAELDIRYRTRQKEQALQLRHKDITLLRAEGKAQQTQRNALIGGTLLLVSLLGLSVNRYRLKQRSNRLLEEQKHALQAQQEQIYAKNEALSRLLGEKNSLLVQKDNLLAEQERLLEEKERLLREIHHRVKNNLQVVMSLLNSQASYLADDTALWAIQESQHRVQAMALIHQKLYQNEGIARIPMADYIQEVVAYLRDSYDLPQLIHFHVTVDPIELDVTQAVPLGLIINEAITNALKYAFPRGRPGTVILALHRLKQSWYELTIHDNGVGLPPDYDPSRSRSLGMTLMRGFSEQLAGEIRISSGQGLLINLVFTDEQLNTGTITTYQSYTS